ncbi:hypothetical protein D0Z07_3414 [Hyphodiscus hymeniophilus]|uniref:Uncharacterized protein n=1 Tax=Hyphodiscus hymeniophilus TaxID=353542 RepID=A0A9P6VMP4_9HELO|nr:hypothetical protein D0Z07_3414 [Hyphodiscus hymeniophilus]
MPVGIQSSNVARLCSELGFSGKHPGRKEKDLTCLTRSFPIDSLSKGTPRPFFRADSLEALQLAIQFCSENQRGHFFWPDNSHQEWPTWLSDQPKCVPLYGTINVRELSPQSQQLVGPPPPKGTRRRPIKAPTSAGRRNSTANGSSSEPATSIDFQPDTETFALYVNHIETLDEDDEKPLHAFTQKWLRSNAEWPESADPRLYNFMHTNRCYDPNHQEDRKELAMVNVLRHNTEIAELHGHPLLYSVLKDRVLERVDFLAQNLITKKILAFDDKNKIQMVKAFRNVWVNRGKFWEKKRAGDPFEGDGLRQAIRLLDDLK